MSVIIMRSGLAKWETDTYGGQQIQQLYPSLFGTLRQRALNLKAAELSHV